MGIYRGLNIVRDGLVFGYDADDRSSRFYKGEPTTNLLINPLMENLTSWTSYRYPTGTYGPNDGITWDTDKIKIVKEGGYSNTQTFLVQFMNLTIGQTYTASVLCKTFNAGAVLDVYTGAAWSQSYCTTYTGEWVKLTTTFTVATSTNCQVRCGIYSNGNATAYFKECQLEQKPHGTQFVVGARTNTNALIDLTKTSTIDLSNVSFDSTAHPIFDGVNDSILIPNGEAPNFGNGAFTLEFITYMTAFGFQGGTYLGKGNGTNTGYSFRDNSFFVFGPTLGLIASIPFAAAQNTWQHHIITYNSTTSPYIKRYLNGILYSSSTNDNSGALGSVDALDDFYIGYNNAGGINRYYNGKMPVVKLYNKALSVDEVQQNYNSYKNRFNI